MSKHYSPERTGFRSTAKNSILLFSWAESDCQSEIVAQRPTHFPLSFSNEKRFLAANRFYDSILATMLTFPENGR
jgi:hypothetical protein